jgi:myo-inositol-1(or 4)-monophosphatase
MTVTVEYLEQIAREAGDIIKAAFFAGSKGVTYKADDSLLTDTDTNINNLVIERFKCDFPAVRVVGEEGDNAVESDEVVIFDPLDGTAGLKAGIPTSCFCIAYLQDGDVLAACIYDPFMDRMYTATKGGGAHANGVPLHVSAQSTLHRATVGVVYWKDCGYPMISHLTDLVEKGANVMAPLSIAYWGALVASGKIDSISTPSFNSWEAAALKLIVEEAGGKVCSLFGDDEEYDGSTEIHGLIVSNGLLHTELLALVSAH